MHLGEIVNESRANDNFWGKFVTFLLEIGQFGGLFSLYVGLCLQYQNQVAMLSTAYLMLSAMDLLNRIGSWLTMASLLLEWMRMTIMTKMTVMGQGRITIFNNLVP